MRRIQNLPYDSSFFSDESVAAAYQVAKAEAAEAAGEDEEVEATQE